MKDIFGKEVGAPGPHPNELYNERDRLRAKRDAGDVSTAEPLSRVGCLIDSYEDGCTIRALGA